MRRLRRRGLVSCSASPMRALLILLLGACSGAAAAPPGPPDPAPTCDRYYSVSSAFPIADRMYIQRACDRWNAFGIEKVCLTDGDFFEHSIRRVHYRSPEWYGISADLGGADWLGVYSGDDRIGLTDGLTPAVLEVTALHEFGHARGLAHTPAPSVMYFSVGTAYDFTEADLTECRRVGACR